MSFTILILVYRLVMVRSLRIPQGTITVDKSNSDNTGLQNIKQQPLNTMVNLIEFSKLSVSVC